MLVQACLRLRNELLAAYACTSIQDPPVVLIRFVSPLPLAPAETVPFADVGLTAVVVLAADMLVRRLAVRLLDDFFEVLSVFLPRLRRLITPAMQSQTPRAIGGSRCAYLC